MRNITISILAALLPSLATATGYELIFKEEEPGIEPYISRTMITERYLRIDDLSDDSGYVLYDDDTSTVYSISHHNESILVIERDGFDRPALSDKLKTSDKALTDAPRIAGKQVNDYRVELEDENLQEMCTHIQYVPGLLTEAGRMLHEYQITMAGNHVNSLENVPPEFRTPCMLSDQVYFDGAVYAKGLPIMEWRSNGRKKLLEDFSEKQHDAAMFELPEGYRRFSLN